MGCTHLNVEEVIESSSGIISKIESIEGAEQKLGCAICNSLFSVEVCIDCNILLCRSKGHVDVHWKDTWHKNYFVPGSGVVSCEECAEYITIPDISRMMQTEQAPIPKKFQSLNLNWVKGFLNLKRTCYVSSLLQSVLSIEVFIQNLLEVNHSMNGCKSTECILCSLNRILFQMYNSTSGYVDISELIKIFWENNPAFAKSEYQDVQEFFMFLSSQVHGLLECNPAADKKCAIHNTFGGVFMSSIICDCSFTEVMTEPFTSISMDIFGGTLESTLDKYFQEEKVVIHKECKCGNTESYTKKVEIKTLPNVLCLHLKRYQVQNKTISKIDTVVSYPEELTVGGKVFTLSSTIMHSGEIDSGHYIAYTRRNSQWYLTNDEEIIRVSLVYLLNKPVYILFYTLNA
ncbi:ubiquitin carboxyl-terminal hydrolase 22/27/51 [Nematocida parisii]|uniref:USP domain-containing protein n=1 Tax=Nematocida parisii (strain ERTm3) TaxID=935791 RepID=I3EE69_NEMP3|nr:uncharacterized protein NEPG_00120 [Nematocida parisii ERTm1]EIJ87516.1 hypothetical protein NEQG_02397 [Nematocida parisii ERTm3]KAI5130085.1 ubiquitin carboxyl-terminal hydrolase 22/27/51 [Nematocida parisii]EIJ94598.1 hypothetical protein NEPG_00120 [Nematocida parisii ERTm1]KAI5130470.1 ubiquitin carboxyl-terminal hydrolase 22/27/51 [Nematocida parisii]KAI5142783.1 ubiquitin carboxyl-terminal hydrolase 22/27/51 [Nematocida parisii]|eukprot:XP_013057954.1 hypothetical protein NEPG_00120 [Nematocida parisii ERTm1]